MLESNMSREAKGPGRHWWNEVLHAVLSGVLQDGVKDQVAADVKQPCVADPRPENERRTDSTGNVGCSTDITDGAGKPKSGFANATRGSRIQP